MSVKPILTYEDGSLILKNFEEKLITLIPGAVFDHRVNLWRARAISYRPIVSLLHSEHIDYTDEARSYKQQNFNFLEKITPRPHQSKAFAAWQKANSQGVVCLPTGGGKTILAMFAIQYIKRSTLIVVPTIDLMHQWQGTLERFLNLKVSLLGGGSHEISDITVSTYQSACNHGERIGNRFGLVVFDECHHLPSSQYQHIALTSIAPYRLGLSATLRRSDGKEDVLSELIGPVVSETGIHEMVGVGLAPFDIITRNVRLSADEQKHYSESRSQYLSFARANGIDFSKLGAWNDFIMKCARSKNGQAAFAAYRRQKKIAQSPREKLTVLWELLQAHANERVIVFTDDNEQAYMIGNYFFLPVLSHKTRPKERKKILEDFRSGAINVLVNSKVLNEGVDVPEASVAIIVAGSGAVREHVQRLGRVLREAFGKRAILYELVSENTSEVYVNERRRKHDAYQGSSEI